MCEILTAKQVGEMLQLSVRSVYALTCKRTRECQTFPIPMIRVNGNLRFVKQDVETWIAKLSQEQAQ
jgi:predicted DNA-binding transcriptional regulator AlpA